MSDPADPFDRNRVIFVHKQGTSARTRFLLLPYGGVLGFSPLPPLSGPADDGAAGAVVPMSRGIVRLAAERLGLAAGDLAPEDDFAATVATPEGSIHIHLARFTAIDPPFALAERLGGRFVEIAGARAVPPLELIILRKAFETVMG